MKIEDAGIGQPPSLLGADPEAVKITQRISCPSPTDSHLRIANLSSDGHDMEILVINPTSNKLELTWEGNKSYELSWIGADGQPVLSDSSQLHVPPYSWIWGMEN